MQNQRANAGTGGGYVYVVVCGETIVPLMKMPTIGSVALYDNASDKFIEGKIVWNVQRNAFEFI